MIKFRHLPTKVNISDLARQNCRQMYGDDLSCLMFESVKNLEEKIPSAKKTNFIKKTIDALKPAKEMSINISSNKYGDFFVHSNLKINKYNFESSKIPFDFFETLSTLKNFKTIVAKTKDDILTKVSALNEFKNYPDKVKFFD